MKQLFLIFFYLVLAVPSVAIAGPASRPVVKIGMILPLTGSTVVWGEDARRASEILEKQLNQDQTKRFRYEFILEDGRCGRGNAAATATQKLVNVDNAQFLVVACSGSILQAAPIVARSKALATCFACSHPDVKKLGDHVFRTYVDMEKGMALMAELVKNEVPGKLVIFTEENRFTVGIKALLVENLGGQIGYTADFDADNADFRTIITKANASKPAAYYLNTASPRTYQALFRQLRELGIREPVLAYHNPADKDSLAALGAVQNGVRFIDVPEIETSDKGFQQFFKSFQEAHPDGPHMDFLLRTSYDAMVSYVSAIEKVGPDTEAVKAFYRENTWRGALGEVRFDEVGDVVGLNFVVKEIVDGKPKSQS